MNQKQINELKQLALKATPGPWMANQDGDGSLCETRRPDGERYIVIEPAEWDDAEYIAAVNPQVILGLLASYERLEKEADWLAHEASYMESELVSERGGFADKENSPEQWREAARKELEESNDNS